MCHLINNNLELLQARKHLVTTSSYNFYILGIILPYKVIFLILIYRTDQVSLCYLIFSYFYRSNYPRTIEYNLFWNVLKKIKLYYIASLRLGRLGVYCRQYTNTLNSWCTMRYIGINNNDNNVIRTHFYWPKYVLFLGLWPINYY